MRFLFVLCLLTPAFGQTPALFGFLPNPGRFPAAVRFLRYSSDNFLYVTPDSFVMHNGIRVQIAGIDPSAVPIGDSPSAAAYNFYQSKDSAQWITGAASFGAVTLDDVYPGVSALFTTAWLGAQPAPAVGQGKVIFSIAPSADPSRIRLRIEDPGATPFESGGGIFFAGGSIPGIFTVSARATQQTGGAAMPVACSLKIESSDTLSIPLPDRNPSLNASVEVTFPDYDVTASPPAAGLLSSSVEYPSNFGADGVALFDCGNGCK